MAVRRPPPPPKLGQGSVPSPTPSTPAPTPPTPPGPKPSERGAPPKPTLRPSVTSSPSHSSPSPPIPSPPNPGRAAPPKPFNRTGPAPPLPKPKVEETKENGQPEADHTPAPAPEKPVPVSTSPPLPPKQKNSVSLPSTPVKPSTAPPVPKPVIRPPPAVKKEEPLPTVVEPIVTPQEEETPKPESSPVTPTKAPVPLKPPPAPSTPISPSPARLSVASSAPPVPRPSTIPNVTVGASSVSLGGGILGSNPAEGKFSGKGLLDMPDLKTLSAVAVAKAFVRSEEAYLKLGLQCVTVEFEMRLNAHIKLGRPILTQEEVSALFLNIDNIYDFNRQLYHELEDIENQGDDKLLAGLGSAMKKYIPFFKLYQKYVEKHRENANLFNRWYKKRDNFRYFVELNELCSGQKLKTLLSAPVTRLAQYLIFLGSVHEKLETSSPGYTPLEEAIRSIQVVTDEIAEKLRDGKARELCVKVQTEIFKGAVDVLSPTRLVHKVGDLNLVGEKAVFGKGRVLTPHCFVLFNDCLLFGIRGGKLSAGKPKGVCRLDGLTTAEVPDDTKQNIINAFEIKHSRVGSLLVTASSAQEKSKWTTEIEKGVAQYMAQKQRAGIASKEVISDDDFEQYITKKKASGKVYSSLPASGGYGTLKAPIAPISSGSGGPSGGALWEKKYDPNTGVYYYENQVTFESQWEPPPGFVDPDGSTPSSGAPPPVHATDAPEAPLLAADAPPPPMMETTPEIASDAPDAPPPATSSPGGDSKGGGPGDLLSSIRSAGGVGGLKRAPPPSRAAPKEEPKGPLGKPDLQATLQKSLANYRQFVQDDEEDGETEDTEWE